MHKVNEAPPVDELIRCHASREDCAADDAAFLEDALARDAALNTGGPAIEWSVFEAWVRSRLAERLVSLPPSLLPGT